MATPPAASAPTDRSTPPAALSPTPAAIPPELAADPVALGESGGFPVYPMPIYTTVPATDVVVSARWYVAALGFGIMYVGPEVGGTPMLVHLRRGKYQDVLLTPAREEVVASGAGGAQVVFAAGDVDALAERAHAAAAVSRSRVEGPTPTPWGAPELRVTDPDGHVLVFYGAPAQPPAGDIDDAMRTAADRLRS